MQFHVILARVQQILLNPKAAWAQIDTEPSNIQDIYRDYIIPLAAIPPVATFLGMAAFGLRFAIIPALVSFALALAAVYVFALIIDYLAPQFKAARNMGQAFKVAAYAPTGAWVAGACNIIPGVGGIISVIGALYSLYLLFLGLPMLMRPPEDKATNYTIAALICAVVVELVLAAIIGRLFAPSVVAVTHS